MNKLQVFERKASVRWGLAFLTVVHAFVLLVGSLMGMPEVIEQVQAHIPATNLFADLVWQWFPLWYIVTVMTTAGVVSFSAFRNLSHK